MYTAENAPKVLQCGLTGAERRGRIISLDQILTQFLMQHKTPWAFFPTRSRCSLTFNWVSTRILRSFSAKLFQMVSPQHVLVHGVISTEVQDSAFLYLKFHKVPVNLFGQPVGVPLSGSATLCCISHSSQLAVISRASSHFKPLVMTFNSVGHWDTLLVIGLQLRHPLSSAFSFYLHMN